MSKELFGIERPCALCHELVYTSEDSKTWGIQWEYAFVHYDCAYNLFNAVRRVQKLQEIHELEAENEELYAFREEHGDG